MIEIGLAYGSSALAIAEALVASRSTEARHVIVDAYQEHFPVCWVMASSPTPRSWTEAISFTTYLSTCSTCGNWCAREGW